MLKSYISHFLGYLLQTSLTLHAPSKLTTISQSAEEGLSRAVTDYFIKSLPPTMFDFGSG